MTAREIADVMEDQFIAVGQISDKRIGYSGAANKFRWYGADLKVIKIIAPKNESSATVIYVE